RIGRSERDRHRRSRSHRISAIAYSRENRSRGLVEHHSQQRKPMTDRSRIDEYWEHPDTISLLDKNLRKLETDFVLSQINASDDLADFGCGDGESTVHYAAKV